MIKKEQFTYDSREISLLPALPLAWKNGTVKGLRARGGVEVDIKWRDYQLKTVTLKAINQGVWGIRYQAQTLQLELKQGQLILA